MNAINVDTLERPSHTLYPLHGDEVNFLTGKDDKDNQYLIFPSYPEHIILKFSEDGCLIETLLLENSHVPHKDSILQEWIILANLHLCPILAKKFSIAKYNIRIEDLPNSIKEILHHPDMFDVEEQEYARRLLSNWNLDGTYVFSIGEGWDCWIDKSGEVIAT